MPESTDQMVLVSSPLFLNRMQYLMDMQARTVLAEALNVAHHTRRAEYASDVVSNPAVKSSTAAVMVVGGVNLIGTVTGSGPTADSSASDASILSQIATFWNAMAGIATGS
jgi:hypothetical protein